MHAPLARHLIESLMDNGFDLASSKCLPEGEGEGHAIAYVHRRVMDARKPVPASAAKPAANPWHDIAYDLFVRRATPAACHTHHAARGAGPRQNGK